jgi:hypothetical protein
MSSEKTRSEMRAHFRKISSLLGEKVASENAARELKKMIDPSRV